MSALQQINIEIVEDTVLTVELSSELVITGSYERYEGAYTVIPSSAAQTLYTADKYVSNNINVREIPYAEVSNGAGGSTVTIG